MGRCIQISARSVSGYWRAAIAQRIVSLPIATTGFSKPPQPKQPLRPKVRFNLFGSIPRSLLRNGDSESQSPSFPHAFSARGRISPRHNARRVRLRRIRLKRESRRTRAGPPIKTFGGDNFGENDHKIFRHPAACCGVLHRLPCLSSPVAAGWAAISFLALSKISSPAPVPIPARTLIGRLV